MKCTILKGDEVTTRGIRGKDNLYRTADNNVPGSVQVLNDIKYEDERGNSSSTSDEDEDNFEDYNSENQLLNWHNLLCHFSKREINHLERLSKIKVCNSGIQRKMSYENSQKVKAHTR